MRALNLRGVSGLARLKLSLAVALSAGTGYVLAAETISASMLLPVAGSFLLAAGASALNQYQESEADSRMRRTCGRPIPAGLIRPETALIIALVTIVAALILFVALCGWRAAALAILVVALYNGLYTSLKRVTAFAVIPGALIGSLGPAIGWVSAGATSASSVLLSVMFLFYLWQMPHLWLLELGFPNDYRLAGYPSATDALGVSGLNRLVIVWTAATLVATLMLPLFGLIDIVGLYVILLLASVSFACIAGVCLRDRHMGSTSYKRGFAGINLYMIVTMILLILDRGVIR